MPSQESKIKDDDVVRFEVGKRDDGRLWVLYVSCPAGLTEQEFAVACADLGNDILEGKVSWETAEDINVN